MDCLDAVADCRLVLCLPANPTQQAALAANGIAAVGLGEPARVAACHAAKLPAFLGQPELLRHHRHKFDGAIVDLDAVATGDLGDAATTLALVEAALQPGGRLAVRAGGNWRTLRTPPRDWPIYPGMVVGAYADRFVGCTRVLTIGCGEEPLTAALRLRDLPVRTCDLATTGLQGLLAHRERGIDGIFVGPIVGYLEPAQLQALFRGVRALLPAHGRVIVRANHEVIANRVQPRLDARDWATVRAARAPRDATDAFLLLRPTTAPVGLPDALAADPVRTCARPLSYPPTTWFDLERCERRITSQTGEDGVLAAIFAKAGTTNRSYVEFGCGDGVQCNTRQLFLQGWRGLLMDGAERPGAPDVVMHAHWIDRDNINSLLDRHDVPTEPDLLSIDLDGNDYWIWQAITRRPRVVVAEYNGNLAADRALTIPYDPHHRWDGSDFYGCSLLALVRLARAKGYTLVHCTTSGVNAFFIRDDLLAGEPPADPLALFRPANYWYRGGRSLPNLNRTMLDVW